MRFDVVLVELRLIIFQVKNMCKDQLTFLGTIISPIKYSPELSFAIFSLLKVNCNKITFMN